MDNNDRRPRTNPQGYAGQQGTLLQPQAQYPVVSASDRFRHAPLTAQPPTSAPSTSRAGAQSYGYAYGEGSQFVQSAIPPSYGTQDYAPEQTPQHQQQSRYSQYGQNVMYNVASAQPQPAGQSQYEPVQQYQSNRDSAIEVLNTSFGVAQPQYYGVPGQEGPTSTPASALATQNVPSQYSSLGYTAPQAAVGRESLAPSYSAPSMTDPHQATSQGGYSHQTYPEQGSSNEFDNFYNNYQTELKKTFESTRDGRLSEAAVHLKGLTDWLLHWAEPLGLVRDDEANYQPRLKLWTEFNDCWLATLQRQKEMTLEMINTQRPPQSPQSLIDRDYLEKMGTELTKNCDNMEKHGLVDYQMGVLEEEIIAMLCACLDLLEEARGVSGSSQRVSTASASRRR
ncbi:hypothetical protein B0J11DRAFT_578666 [Dendryphion nanum]|uniref:Uncharacterized protein n=1 Tax=Dendryphion nanum TaxID=256645 RepID=A0A9P9E0K5_9PLEO|nr:hypothetical protein B0J11DRAFT_578666 [Dendryphion nanum]